MNRAQDLVYQCFSVESALMWIAHAKGEESWERGFWVLGVLGGEACQEGQLQRQRGTKGLSNLRVPSYSPCTPAACFIALAASAHACVWRGRRFHDVAYLLLKTTHLVPGTRIRAHPHAATYVGVDFDCWQPLTQSHCLVLCLSRPRVRRSWPCAAATAACVVAHAVCLAV